jgi:hypothetical protein
VILSDLLQGGFMHHNEEARYHFIMMDFVDLIGYYGYDAVMADLDVAIADKVNRLVQRAVAEDKDD